MASFWLAAPLHLKRWDHASGGLHHELLRLGRSGRRSLPIVAGALCLAPGTTIWHHYYLLVSYLSRLATRVL